MSHTTETKHDHYYRFFVVETLWPCNLHRNLRQFVSNTTNNDIAAHFLLLQHFWPCLNNVFTSMKCLFHIDDLFQKRKDSPTSVKMGRNTPVPPCGGTSLCQPLATTPPKKTEKKIHRTPSYVHLKWKYNIRLPPKERPSRAKAARVRVVNLSWQRWKSAVTCFISWSSQCAIYCVDCGSWFFASFHYLRFHPLLWILICTF